MENNYNNDISSGDERMRAATLSDYNAVVAIDRDVYSGLDYLPATYPTLLQKPGSSAYVYEKGERVVGFVVGSGQTLVTSAARIAADCRKGGMYSRFIRQVFQQFRGSRDPDYVAFSTNNVNMAANGHKLLKTYRIVEERVITTVLVDLTQAKQKVLREDSDLPALKQQSREDIEDMMSLSQSDLKLLFPNGRVTVEWKPHRIMTANTDLVFSGGNNRIILARSRDSSKHEDSASAGVSATLLSVGGFSFCKRGVRYQLDVFGTGSEQEMRAHVERHFRRLIESCDSAEAIFQIYFSRNVDDILDGMRDQFCLKAADQPFVKMIVLEAPFRDVVKL